MKEVFAIVLLVLLVGMTVTVTAPRQEVGYCYFMTDCYFDETGRGYRYWGCVGAYSQYGEWKRDLRCPWQNMSEPYQEYEERRPKRYHYSRERLTYAPIRQGDF